MNTIKSSTIYVVETVVTLGYSETEDATFTIESYNDKEQLVIALLEQCSDSFKEAYEKQDAFIRVKTLEEWVKDRYWSKNLPWFMTAE